MTFNCPDASINISQMTQNKIKLNFYFIKKTSEMTSAMQETYEELREKLPVLKSIFAISQGECLEIPKAKFRQGKCIFIFDDFSQENEAFKYIFNTNGVFIFGTRCLFTMLIEQAPTPQGLYHVHNLSMRNLIICPTGMNKEKKRELKNLVNFMGGIYLDYLTDGVTHLVSDTVRSVKYETAAKNGIKVMHADWITSVWQKSQNATGNIVATDVQFESFKLPVFFSLCVTTTGMNTQDREMIKTNVEDNGGRYSPSFNGTVDILIMSRDAIGSQKFKAAQKLGKLCLLPSWITDSLDQGFSIANEPYQLHDLANPPSEQMKASTPTKNANVTVSKFNPDNTQLSEISRHMIPDISLCETNTSLRPSVAGNARPSTSGLRSSVSVTSSDYKSILTKITLAEAKKAGNVLDGLIFHLIGFSNEEMALLGKVLSSLGGTKIDHISDQITHFIVGALDPKLFMVLDNYHIDPIVLSISWLVKVIQEQKAVEENDFLIERLGKQKIVNEKPSPASKRAMKSLSSTFKKPAIPKFQLDDMKKNDVEQESVLSQYLDNHKPEDESNFTETAKFLMGKYVFVHGFCDSSSGTVILQECERAGAALVDDTFHREIDYIISPSQIMPKLLHHNIKKFRHIVSDRWLEESTTAGECVPVMFYHKPLMKLLPKEQPLQDEIFVVSNYKNMERDYIKRLVRILGGDCLEILRRTDNPTLISPNMTGAKCTSAKGWDLSVLPVEWLIECYETKQRVDETNFLLGGTKPTSRNKKKRESVILSSQDRNFSQNEFDELDPPIENCVEEESYKAGQSNTTPLRLAQDKRSTEATPDTPYQLNASVLCRDMSTPRRAYIKKLLAEGKQERPTSQALSPRRKRIESILDTPIARRAREKDVNVSPFPEIPDCLKPTQKDYSLRPNSSPESQWFHKRKLEALDTNYYGHPPQEKRSRVVQQPDETIPHTNDRYDFFRGFDPNITNPPTQSDDASKFLPVTDDGDNQQEEERDASRVEPALTEADDDFRFFEEIQTKSLERAKKGGRRYVKPDMGGFSQTVAPCYDSENLVEWRNVGETNSRKSSLAKTSFGSANNQTRLVPLFGIHGLTEEEKKVVTDRVNSLGAEVTEDKNFTHLIIPKPNKSEKFLLAVVKGLFVVHSEYAGRCENQSTFLDESEYEMGNPKFLKSIAAAFDLDVTTALFKSAYKWRMWITKEHRRKFKNGAFTDITFLIAGSPAKKGPVVNIITEGGGRCIVFEQQDAFDENLLKREGVKNCLIESPKLINPANAAIIRKLGIKLANMQSVFNYLMLEKVPLTF